MDRDELCSRFLDTVSYDLYPVQEEALLAWFEADGGVLVSAPTGMGKTLIAEAAIFEALHTGQRLYYTAPLIALAEQKFREFQALVERWGFSRDDVGLLTGNRKVNPEAPVRVVVAEILLNHLLADDDTMADVGGVVMDEFHFFNDRERGIVWELSLVMLPRHVRLMLLSATVGNAAEFVSWLREQHRRDLKLVSSTERRVPLDFHWVGDKLLTEQLLAMVTEDDTSNRSPALVFCFNRDACWEVAERLKGLKFIDQDTRAQIENQLDPEMFAEGVGPKLRQMLIRGVGVHHAGVLPKYKQVVESLFLKKLIPFVICTETLAAGVNLPARSVVISALLQGKRGEKKLIPASSAHQMFGRAGRPQFDSKGYVYALAHEDDVKIVKWRTKYDQIDPNSKDPGLMRARKQLEKKRPRRRKTEQYWAEGQFNTLIESGPAKLRSQSMIPYHVLIYLLSKTGRLHETQEFLGKRFNTPERIAKFQVQLDYMISNLSAFGYLTRGENSDEVTVNPDVEKLLTFRTVDPLYGAFLAGMLARGNFIEKVQSLEAALSLSPAIARRARLIDPEPGPLQTEVVQPRMIQMGLLITDGDGNLSLPHAEDEEDYWEQDDRPKPLPSLPEMIEALFSAKLVTPERITVQPKWIAGGLFDMGCDFYKFTRLRDLNKNEGIVLRHLLRLVVLAGELHVFSGEDPEYAQIGELATRCCHSVDPTYTDRFLANEEEAKKLKQL